MDMSRHPSAAAQLDDPRERIMAALRHRAEGAAPQESPAFAGDREGAGNRTPNLPALITALPGDHTRAPQTEFDRARQVLFIENLSVTGSVRSAAAAAQTSHQSAYRARRACGSFRTAWDGALVVARANAADTLACRAIDGIEEKVFYHGEEVATRTRYSDRLLLAHLARLDKLAETPAASAFAEDFDGSLAAFGRGEEVARPATTSAHPELVGSEADPEGQRCERCANVLRQAQHERGGAGERAGVGEGEIFSPGPCNTRSKSYTPDDDLEDDDGVDWEDEEEAEAEVARLEAAMAAERPGDAPRLTGEGADDPGGLIEDAQFQAYARGVPRWWLVLPPVPPLGEDGWRYADPADYPAPEAEAEAEEELADDDEEEGEEEGDEAGAEEEDRDWLDGELDEEEEPESEPPPEPSPPPPLNRVVKPWPRQPWDGRPINDGRLQPFYGRSW